LQANKGQNEQQTAIYRVGYLPDSTAVVCRLGRTCNEDVGGSAPLAGSSYIKGFLVSGSPFFMVMAHLLTNNGSNQQQMKRAILLYLLR